MNDTQTNVPYPMPPRPVRTLINALVTAILHSPLHGMRSHQLLLITFTGRKSGKQFTTPIRYVQEGETVLVKIPVEYSWWKNLVEKPTVRVLLRGTLRTGTAEVLPEEGSMVVVKLHLRG